MSATNRGAVRLERDAYMTPPDVAERVVREIVFPPHPRVLEPCRGSGNIVRALEQSGVRDIEWCEITEGRDFLTWDFGGRRFDLVLTNPPFSLAREFIERALGLANCVIMLLPLSFLASQSRRKWWETRRPTGLWVLSKRPSFTGRGTDANDYAWFVWDSTGRQKRGLHWL